MVRYVLLKFMFCPNCGAQVAPDANFCSHCGKALRSINPANSFATLFKQEFYVEYSSVDFHNNTNYVRPHTSNRRECYCGAFCVAKNNSYYIVGPDTYDLPHSEDIKDVKLFNNVQLICACKRFGKWGIYNSKGRDALDNFVTFEYDEITIYSNFDDRLDKDKVLIFAVCKKGGKACVRSVNTGKVLIEPGYYDDYRIGHDYEPYRNALRYKVQGKRGDSYHDIYTSDYSYSEWWVNL